MSSEPEPEPPEPDAARAGAGCPAVESEPDRSLRIRSDRRAAGRARAGAVAGADPTSVIATSPSRSGRCRGDRLAPDEPDRNRSRNRSREPSRTRRGSRAGLGSSPPLPRLERVARGRPRLRVVSTTSDAVRLGTDDELAAGAGAGACARPPQPNRARRRDGGSRGPAARQWRRRRPQRRRPRARHRPWPRAAPPPAPAHDLGHALGRRVTSPPFDATRVIEPGRRERRRGLAQRVASAVQQLAHGAVAHAELVGDLVVAAALERLENDRAALALGQLLHRGHHRAQPLAALERLGRGLDAVDLLAHLLVVEAVLAQEVQRRVVRDPVQPRPQVQLGVARVDRAVGAEEGLLDGVLRPARREQPRRSSAAAGGGSAATIASKARSFPSRVRSTSRASVWDRSSAVPAWRAGSIRLLGVIQAPRLDCTYPSGGSVRHRDKEKGAALAPPPSSVAPVSLASWGVVQRASSIVSKNVPSGVTEMSASVTTAPTVSTSGVQPAEPVSPEPSLVSPCGRPWCHRVARVSPEPSPAPGRRWPVSPEPSSALPPSVVRGIARRPRLPVSAACPSASQPESSLAVARGRSRRAAVDVGVLVDCAGHVGAAVHADGERRAVEGDDLAGVLVAVA